MNVQAEKLFVGIPLIVVAFTGIADCSWWGEDSEDAIASLANPGTGKNPVASVDRHSH